MYRSNTMPYIYWSLQTKVSALQRQIIVHSIIYYHLNSSVISDREFDRLSKELVQLMESGDKALQKTDYWYCMYDFDGSTGFHLYDRLTEYDKQYLTKIARYVLSLKG